MSRSIFYNFFRKYPHFGNNSLINLRRDCPILQAVLGVFWDQYG
jgi:hypothetical protein